MSVNIPVELGEMIALHFPLSLVIALGCFPYVQKTRVRSNNNGTRLWNRYDMCHRDSKEFGTYLVDHCIAPVNHDCGGTMRLSAKRGHLNVVAFLLNIVKKCPDYVMDEAATYGHLDIVQFLHDNGQPCTRKALDGATKNGHLDILAFLDGIGVRPSFSVLALAIEYGQLHLLEWLYANEALLDEDIEVYERKDMLKNAINRAAEHGHHDVLIYLHKLKVEFTVNAMERAAANGHIHIVTFLHAIAMVPFTKEAMKMAVIHGHLDVVAYFHANGQPFTENDVELALRNGHDHIVGFMCGDESD